MYSLKTLRRTLQNMQKKKLPSPAASNVLTNTDSVILSGAKDLKKREF